MAKEQSAPQPIDTELIEPACADIPAVVEAMRQYWMPIRYARAG
jgi:hypothetical protein